jgi:hypothetical protein
MSTRLEEEVPLNLCSTSSRPYTEFYSVTTPLETSDGRIRCPVCKKWLKMTAQATYRRHVQDEGT